MHRDKGAFPSSLKPWLSDQLGKATPNSQTWESRSFKGTRKSERSTFTLQICKFMVHGNKTKQITPKCQRSSQWLDQSQRWLQPRPAPWSHRLSLYSTCLCVRKSLSHMGAGRGHWAQTGCNCCPGTLDGERPLGIESRWGAVSPFLQEKNTGSKVPSTHHYWCCWL